MKNSLWLLLTLLTITGLRATAQNINRENLNSYKIGFFTKRLNLTSAEAEAFWPVYNEYQDQKSRLQLEKVLIIRNFNQNESILTDKQITESGNKLIGLIEQESSLAVNFHGKLKEILAPAKVLRFYQAENQYKAQLLNELQNNKGQRRINPARDF
jgi:hypothetical protein